MFSRIRNCLFGILGTFFGYFDSQMKIHLEQNKHVKKMEFVDSGFVETCHELDNRHRNERVGFVRLRSH